MSCFFLFLFKPIQVFNQEGEFILKFGSNGEGNGQFNAPTGVAVDSNGNIIVADWGNSRIQVEICVFQRCSIRKTNGLITLVAKVFRLPKKQDSNSDVVSNTAFFL